MSPSSPKASLMRSLSKKLLKSLSRKSLAKEDAAPPAALVSMEASMQEMLSAVLPPSSPMTFIHTTQGLAKEQVISK
jgi:hypothetical protein